MFDPQAVTSYVRITAVALLLAWLASDPCAAQAGARNLLVVCGHPGDDEYREQFATTLDTLVRALAARGGFSAERTIVLFGTPDMQSDEGLRPALEFEPCTAESLQAAVKELKSRLAADDTLWVVFCGHAHFDGRQAWFNVAGTDPSQGDLGQMFSEVRCRECVFWMTTSVSGFFVRPLASEGRLVISATEVDREVNATEFPHVLAEVLADPPPFAEFDADGDGRPSLLDLYLTVCRRVGQRYVDNEYLATEHAQLEDNGDGRPTEVQRRFLPEELDGTRQPDSPPPQLLPNQDGVRAAAVELPWLKVEAEPASEEPN